MKKEFNRTAVLIAIVACLLIIYLCTIIGNTAIPFGDANRILLKELFHLPVSTGDFAPGNTAIIWNLRLPRVILGFIAGGSLALCGAAYQGIFKNPMADPFIIGVSSGAALGASVGIVLNIGGGFLGLSTTAILAFVGALGTILIVYQISKVGRKVPVASLLLSGIAVGRTLDAFMSLLMIFNVDSMTKIMFWTMGSFNGKGWDQILVVLPYVLIGAAVLMTCARELDLMLLGEDTATQLGVDTEILKRKVLIASSLMTAAVVSVTGIIGFVGLVVPHIVRMLTGPKHRVLFPVSIVMGGTFLIICDTVARSIAAFEIPVGIITGAFGGPFFVYLLRQTKKGGTV